LTLALGIGANSAVFSAINAVLLQPLPFPDGDRLMRLMQKQDRSAETNIAPVRLEDWNRLNSTFEAITGYFVEMCQRPPAICRRRSGGLGRHRAIGGTDR
jgi:putative ABC transport system permease protein